MSHSALTDILAFCDVTFLSKHFKTFLSKHFNQIAIFILLFEKALIRKPLLSTPPLGPVSRVFSALLSTLPTCWLSVGLFLWIVYKIPRVACSLHSLYTTVYSYMYVCWFSLRPAAGGGHLSVRQAPVHRRAPRDLLVAHRRPPLHALRIVRTCTRTHRELSFSVSIYYKVH